MAHSFEHLYDRGMGAAQVHQVVEVLAGLDGGGLEDAERVELLTALERVKGAAAAAQARVTVAFADSQLAGLGGTAREQAEGRRSVGSQVALARHLSPSRGDQCVGLARALVREMPETMAALSRGEIGERAAVEVVRATAVADLELRREVDRRLAPLFGRVGVRALAQAARAGVAELDAAAVVAARERAVASRRVSLRPAPDGMAYLTVLGPLRESVGAYAALRRHAAAVTAGHGPEGEAPDGRGAGAVMADAALRWLSGRKLGEAQPVLVNLVMTDRALTGIGRSDRDVDEPARVVGTGEPVPSTSARDWLAAHADAPEEAKAWVRRVFTAPEGRDLVAVESRSELFPASLRSLLVLRDDTCRTPFCDAPIAQADHVVSRARGGPTTERNGQGQCVRCNLTKEAPGWTAEVGSAALADPQTPHEVVTTTPTGHRYRSTAPPLLGWGWSPPEPRGPDDVDVSDPRDPWDDVDWEQILHENPLWHAELAVVG